jgi:RNA polymerase sigma-70 factor, ECF subfamily
MADEMIASSGPASSSGRDSYPDPVLAPTDASGQARLVSLVQTHFDFVWRYLRRMGVADGDADDGAQRVFLTAASRLDDIRAGADRAFLRGIALRVASHMRRSYRRRAEEALEPGHDGTPEDTRPDSGPLPDEYAIAQDGRRLVEGILDEMDDELREVFVLFEIEELPSAAIAELLELAEGTVKSRLRRARDDFEARARRLRAREADATSAREAVRGARAP